MEHGSETEALLDELFNLHYARLVQHLSVAAGSRHLAEDAVQEAFAEAFNRWERLSSYEDPVGWVRRVALNRIRNRHRGFRRLRVARERLAGQRMPVEDEFDRWIATNDVGEAVAGLSARQREAVSLYYLEGLPVAAVAAEMGVTQGSVKTHLHRARRALTVRLEEVR